MSKVFEWILEVIGWLRIIASPLFMGLVIGLPIYLYNPNKTNLFIFILLASLGLIIGVIWATRILKSKNGTWFFISQVSSTPELERMGDSDLQDVTKP